MFEVRWIDDALQDLAQLWMDADSDARQMITAATSAADHELQTDPFRQSESRENDERVYWNGPLGFRIDVDTDQRKVWVLQVWRVKQRGR